MTVTNDNYSNPTFVAHKTDTMTGRHYCRWCRAQFRGLTNLGYKFSIRGRSAQKENSWLKVLFLAEDGIMDCVYCMPHDVACDEIILVEMKSTGRWWWRQPNENWRLSPMPLVHASKVNVQYGKRCQPPAAFDTNAWPCAELEMLCGLLNLSWFGYGLNHTPRNDAAQQQQHQNTTVAERTQRR